MGPKQTETTFQNCLLLLASPRCPPPTGGAFLSPLRPTRLPGGLASRTRPARPRRCKVSALETNCSWRRPASRPTGTGGNNRLAADCGGSGGGGGNDGCEEALGEEMGAGEGDEEDQDKTAATAATAAAAATTTTATITATAAAAATATITATATAATSRKQQRK